MISVFYLSQDALDRASSSGDLVKLTMQRCESYIILHYIGHSEGMPLLLPNDKLEATNSNLHKIIT